MMRAFFQLAQRMTRWCELRAKRRSESAWSARLNFERKVLR